MEIDTPINDFTAVVPNNASIEGGKLFLYRVFDVDP
jgi:hypothetical protein